MSFMSFGSKTFGFDLLLEVIFDLGGGFVVVKLIEPFANVYAGRGRLRPGDSFEESFLVLEKLSGSLMNQVQEEDMRWAFLLADAPDAEGARDDELVGWFHRAI